MKQLTGLCAICAAAFLGACGGGDEDRTQAFIGTWTYASGSTSNFDCDNNQLDDMEDQAGQNLVLQAGVESDLVIAADPDVDCPPTKLNVSGSVAKAEGNATCTTMTDLGGGNQLVAMINIQNITLTLDSAGTKLDAMGSIAINFSGAATATCTASLVGSATKTGN